MATRSAVDDIAEVHRRQGAANAIPPVIERFRACAGRGGLTGSGLKNSKRGRASGRVRDRVWVS
jgi:hypothetical protein